MASKLRAHLTYANVVSSVCLFVVLGGTSYAVATGSIGSPQIVNNSVRSKDVRNNDLRSADVRNGALLAQDFKAGQLQAGPKGDPGAPGAPGQTGQPGPPGISGLERVTAESVSNSVSPKALSATCPPGKRVIGASGEIIGGVDGVAPDLLTDVVIREITPSGPASAPVSANVVGIEEDATNAPWSVVAYAVCANVS